MSAAFGRDRFGEGDVLRGGVALLCEGVAGAGGDGLAGRERIDSGGLVAVTSDDHGGQ